MTFGITGLLKCDVPDVTTEIGIQQALSSLNSIIRDWAIADTPGEFYVLLHNFEYYNDLDNHEAAFNRTVNEATQTLIQSLAELGFVSTLSQQLYCQMDYYEQGDFLSQAENAPTDEELEEIWKTLEKTIINDETPHGVWSVAGHIDTDFVNTAIDQSIEQLEFDEDKGEIVYEIAQGGIHVDAILVVTINGKRMFIASGENGARLIKDLSEL
jgi:hypothetical protein